MISHRIVIVASIAPAQALMVVDTFLQPLKAVHDQ